MTFGRASGLPASAKQVGELLVLVRAAGHSGFRDARGPLHLTQRQASGKFTRDEADALVAQLRGEEPGEDTTPSARDAAEKPARQALVKATATPGSAVPATRLSEVEQALRRLPPERLALELRRRGWTVTEPSVPG